MQSSLQANSRSRGALRASLVVQWRVIHALLMRELITRFGRDNLGVLWLVAEPMVFTLGVATLWAFSGLRHGYGISPVALAVTLTAGRRLSGNLPRLTTTSRDSGVVPPKPGRVKTACSRARLHVHMAPGVPRGDDRTGRSLDVIKWSKPKPLNH